ncbi:MAG: heparinase II/III family protein [Vicinamibacterales bacterium]
MSGWRAPCLVNAGTVHLLGVTGDVSAPAIWNSPDHARLWIYHLHYFDDLTARDAERRTLWHRRLVDRWIAENPPGVGAGWEPYPVSLRIVNWIKWVLRTGADQTHTRVLQSLAIQARWLRRRMEHHILANHLWANAKALLMAGVVFDGEEADRWRREGMTLVARELREQVLPDGGHFERSPMYHAIVLEDVLDLLQLGRLYPESLSASLTQALESAATRMLRWLRIMSHPDGDISFFNDAACDAAASYAALEAYARGLRVAVIDTPLTSVEVLAESGYVRLTNERAVVLCDVAPVGPDYQPGHAHADTLSFELSLDGRRVLVNGGTSTYVPGPVRHQERSTSSHNTVVVDGRNSSDVWGGFRVGRRARPLQIHAVATSSGGRVEAAHDGYAPVVHRRRWELDQAGLTVSDVVDGQHADAAARLLWHPAAAAAPIPPVRVECDPEATIATVPAHWSPRFGERIPTSAMVLPLTDGELTTRVTWV